MTLLLKCKRSNEEVKQEDYDSPLIIFNAYNCYWRVINFHIGERGEGTLSAVL